MYLEISNLGEIEPEALTLLGGTTKADDESKIGMFGSGNKYAIAYFIRNNIGLQIFSGQDRVEITTKRKCFRGQEIDVICVAGNETSITTKTGPQWKLWQCIREIYSNAIDEGIIKFGMVDRIDPEAGKTKFYIHATEEVKEFYEVRDMYFHNGETVLFKGKNGSILKKSPGKVNVYRRGIRCYESQEESVYDYDLPDIEINESRLVQNTANMKNLVYTLMGECTDPNIIRNFLKDGFGVGDYFENNDYLDYYWNNDRFKPSAAWDEVLKGKYIAPYLFGGWVKDHLKEDTFFIGKKLYVALVDQYGSEIDALGEFSGDHIKYKIKDPTALQEAKIKKAVEFLKEVEFTIDYPIYLGEFMVADKTVILGFADKESIILSETCLEGGVQKIVETIIEEYVHLKHRCNDETRHMQDKLIEELVNYMQFKNAIIL